MQTNTKALTRYRLAKGYSQTDLAEKAGLTPSHITRLETGKRGMRPSTAKALADALDVKIEDIAILPVAASA